MISVCRILLCIAGLGVLTSAGFLAMLVIATLRFRRAARLAQAQPPRFLPGATMMKPLCGLEPRLEENLASFFTQQHPEFEIIFGTRDASDPALTVVERLRRRYPQVPVQIVFSGEPDAPNAKICTLRKMFEVARYEYVVISDSDVGVAPDYLARVVAPLADPQVGLVMCLYRGVPTGGLWTRLEALAMSVEMTSGVLASSVMGKIDFALGPTMATRRSLVEELGGIGMAANYCADDYVLGNRIAALGRTVVISDKVIDHYVVNRSLGASMRHQRRWMLSTRFSIPTGHALSVLSMAMPFGVLGALAGWGCGQPRLGLAMLAATLLNRVATALLVGWGVVRDRRAIAGSLLYPLRELMGFGFWLSSYTGNSIDWRGERYRLLPGGLMQRLREH